MKVDESHPWWGRLATCLLSAEVQKGLEAAPQHRAGETVWFLAVGGCDILGFVAAHVGDSRTVWAHDFVYPQYRRKGVYRRLCRERETFCADHRVQVVARLDRQIAMLKEFGLSETSRRGSWSVLTRDTTQT